MLEYLDGHCWVIMARLWPGPMTKYTGYRHTALVLEGLLTTCQVWSRYECYRLRKGKIRAAARLADRQVLVNGVYSTPLTGRFITLAGDQWCCYALDTEFRLYEGWTARDLKLTKI
jgi:hypothetical protein